MTRFARYKKDPEDSTPWNELRKQCNGGPDHGEVEGTVVNKSSPPAPTETSEAKKRKRRRKSKKETKTSPCTEEGHEPSPSTIAEEHIPTVKTKKFKHSDGNPDHSTASPNKKVKTGKKSSDLDGQRNGAEERKAQFERLERYNGTNLPKDTARRLKDMESGMRGQGMKEGEIKEHMKLERRREEKRFRRIKQKVCFKCRKFGHELMNCPLVKDATADGICFKCGSHDHTSRNCKKGNAAYAFANCFICGTKGHLARECQNNAKGVYPNGGNCRFCGSVRHKREDCPMDGRRTFPGLNDDEADDGELRISTLDGSASADAEVNFDKGDKVQGNSKPKVVKF